MTGFTNTPFGKAAVSILVFFGIDKAKATTEVNTEAQKIDTDIQGLTAAVLPEIEALGETALTAIVSKGVADVEAAAKSGTGAESLLDVVYESVKKTAEAEFKTLSPIAINFLGTLIQAHTTAA